MRSSNLFPLPFGFSTMVLQHLSTPSTQSLLYRLSPKLLPLLQHPTRPTRRNHDSCRTPARDRIRGQPSCTGLLLLGSDTILSFMASSSCERLLGTSIILAREGTISVVQLRTQDEWSVLRDRSLLCVLEMTRTTCLIRLIGYCMFYLYRYQRTFATFGTGSLGLKIQKHNSTHAQTTTTHRA